jgi:hypothetical protein
MLDFSRRELARYRPLIYIAYAGVATVTYIALTPPAFDEGVAASLPVLGTLPGDLPSYVLRFAASALLFGLLPLGLALLLGEKLRTLGLVVPHGLLKERVFLAALAVIVLVGVLGAYNPGLYEFYPFSSYIEQVSAGGRAEFFALHVLAYALLYYLPWEFLFRGLLILPIVRHFEPDSHRRLANPAILAIASFQLIPSAMLHIGHPLSESVGAVAFGILSAYLVLKTNSIFLPLVLHVAAGVILDGAIILRTAGVLP